MRIIDLLSKDSISLRLQAKNKMEAINELVDLVDASGHLTDKKAYKEELLRVKSRVQPGLEKGLPFHMLK